jgi:cytidylate kinase
MNNKIIIAIDGPAGAGKSTIAKIISKKLNIEYIDSGAFYRAITKNILDSNLKIDDYRKIVTLLESIELKLENNKIFINNTDMTDYLRTDLVTSYVSPVSSIIEVRKMVNEYLNEYSQSKSVIMDGRDIGTIVFPDADYKFYLDASVEIRAERRFKEGTSRQNLQEIKEAIIRRDENDKTKEYGALKIADDAIYIDTTNMSKDDVVINILKRIK